MVSAMVTLERVYDHVLLLSLLVGKCCAAVLLGQAM